MTGKLVILLFLVLALRCVQLEKTAAPKLSQYNVDKDKISISGFSSGAYFSVQFHVSFSETIMGAGIATGGPYWCAAEQPSFKICIEDPKNVSVTQLVNATYTFASTGAIDPPENLKSAKVFIFSGKLDTVVNPGIVKKTEEYYRYFVSSDNIATEYSIPAEHAIVTDDYGNSCVHLASPYINQCNYSTATHILQHIYPDVKSPINQCNYSTATHILQHIYPDVKSPASNYAKEDNLMEFDQTEFFNETLNLASMDSIGYIYVPTACKSGIKQCRLHLVFHGCEQGRKYISTLFVLHAGYNSVAELNDIIVVYPQIERTDSNHYGCWDWVGSTGHEYASKQGVQMAGVKLMLNCVAGPLS